VDTLLSIDFIESSVSASLLSEEHGDVPREDVAVASRFVGRREGVEEGVDTVDEGMLDIDRLKEAVAAAEDPKVPGDDEVEEEEGALVTGSVVLNQISRSFSGPSKPERVSFSWAGEAVYM
jgi:hypothetical protein